MSAGISHVRGALNGIVAAVQHRRSNATLEAQSHRCIEIGHGHLQQRRDSLPRQGGHHRGLIRMQGQQCQGLIVIEGTASVPSNTRVSCSGARCPAAMRDPHTSCAPKSATGCGVNAISRPS